MTSDLQQWLLLQEATNQKNGEAISALWELGNNTATAIMGLRLVVHALIKTHPQPKDFLDSLHADLQMLGESLDRNGIREGLEEEIMTYVYAVEQ